MPYNSQILEPRTIQCVGLARKSYLLKKMMMPLIDDFLTRLLGPYQKYEALTFTYGSRKLGPYKKDRTSYFLVWTE